MYLLCLFKTVIERVRLHIMAINFVSIIIQIIFIFAFIFADFLQEDDSFQFALHPHSCTADFSQTFHNFQCLNTVVDLNFTGREDTIDRIACIFKYFPYIPRKLRSFESILKRNISRERRPNVLYCEDFLIITSNVSRSVPALLATGLKRFRPFSRIIFVYDDDSSSSNSVRSTNTNSAWNVGAAELDYIKDSAIYVYLLDFGISGFRGGINILTNQYWPSELIRQEWFSNDDHSHPLIAQKNGDNIFRIGLYNCPPYVVYDEVDRR